MTATLASWLERIGVEHPRGIERGLAHVRTVAERLGVLPPAKRTIVVAGTNGKGSTTVFAEQLVLASGGSVGTTTSPHVHRFNERIRLNGEEADDGAIVQALEAVEAAREDVMLSYFEYAILAALVAVRNADVDVAVLEIGLGGRLDAVNVVDGDVTVITSIGLDHQECLGDPRELIGAEKAGILRRRRPLVIGELCPPRSVLARAAELSAPLFRAGRQFGSTASGLWVKAGDDRRTFDYDQGGAVDAVNAATALQAVLLTDVAVDADTFAGASNNARNPGRCEVVERDGRTWLFDVGHNPDGAEFLARQIGERFAGRRVQAIVGCLADKDVGGVVAALRPVVTGFAFANTHTARGRDAAGMRVDAGELDAFAGDLDAAMAHFRRADDGSGVILVCGSFDVVERARDWLLLPNGVPSVTAG